MLRLTVAELFCEDKIADDPTRANTTNMAIKTLGFLLGENSGGFPSFFSSASALWTIASTAFIRRSRPGLAKPTGG